MRIAVVDDNRNERSELAGWVQNALARRCWPAECLEFDDGGDFLEVAGQQPFDLAFLDIYMDRMDGMTAAKTLRTFDKDCILVFTTTSTDHALDSYRVRAMQYLVKPYQQEDVEQLFEEISQRLPAPEPVLELKVGRQPVRLPLGELLWAEHFQHQIHIHTRSGGKIAARMTFGEFAGLLSKEGRILVCGRGVLVNLTHVKDFDGSRFLLDNGAYVPVSRSAVDAARRAFGEYLFGRRRMEQ